MRSFVPLFALAVAARRPAIAAEPVPVPTFRSVQLRGGGDVTIVPARYNGSRIVEGSTQFTRIRVDRDGQLQHRRLQRALPAQLPPADRDPSHRAYPISAIDGGGLITTAAASAAAQLSVGVNGGGKIDARSVDAADVGARSMAAARSVCAPARACGGGQRRRRNSLFGQPDASRARSTAAAPSHGSTKKLDHLHAVAAELRVRRSSSARKAL